MAISEWQKKYNSYSTIHKNQYSRKCDPDLNRSKPQIMYKGKNSTVPPLHLVAPVESSEVNDTWYHNLVNVSIITEFFPPDYAATGQLIEELVTELEKQGVSIKVFTGQPGYAFTTARAPAL
jgi:hypothetical protein